MVTDCLPIMDKLGFAITDDLALSGVKLIIENRTWLEGQLEKALAENKYLRQQLKEASKALAERD